MVWPTHSDKPKYTRPHVDHKFPHTNMLIYLTDAGGKTIVEDISKREESTFSLSLAHDPKEDDVVTFGGQYHCHELPKEKPRLVIVTTYI